LLEAKIAVLEEGRPLPDGGRDHEGHDLGLEREALRPCPGVPGLGRRARRSIAVAFPPIPGHAGIPACGPMPDADLLERIRGVLDAAPFHGAGHRKVWAEEVQGSDEP